MHPVEALTIITALAMEGWGISSPTVNMTQTKFFRNRTMFSILVAMYLLIAGLSYYVFTLFWILDNNLIVKAGGSTLLILSFGSLFLFVIGKLSLRWRLFDSALSFLSLIFIGYCRLKGW